MAFEEANYGYVSTIVRSQTCGWKRDKNICYLLSAIFAFLNSIYYTDLHSFITHVIINKHFQHNKLGPSKYANSLFGMIKANTLSVFSLLLHTYTHQLSG